MAGPTVKVVVQRDGQKPEEIELKADGSSKNYLRFQAPSGQEDILGKIYVAKDE